MTTQEIKAACATDYCESCASRECSGECAVKERLKVLTDLAQLVLEVKGVEEIKCGKGYSSCEVCPYCEICCMNKHNKFNVQWRALIVGRLGKVEELFKKYRFDKDTHLGLGDIRLSIGEQEKLVTAIRNLFLGEVEK